VFFELGHPSLAEGNWRLFCAGDPELGGMRKGRNITKVALSLHGLNSD
jgi:hypothetical protein